MGQVECPRELLGDGNQFSVGFSHPCYHFHSVNPDCKDQSGHSEDRAWLRLSF